MLSDTPSFRFLAACLLLPLSTAQHVVVPGSVPGSLFSPHGLPPATSAPRHQQSEVKILVCGDSISQGKENDFTWRYRLWEWFEQQSTTTTTSTTPTLKYVGPYNGTLPSIIPESALYTNPDNPFEVPKPQTWGTYHPSVSPAFSPLGGSAHFAVYGRPAWQDIDLLAEQVTTHQPDLVILHLGFNDIGWWGATPESLTETVQQLVWNARTAKRDVAVLIADVSHRLLVGGREDIPGTTDRYNKLLREKAAEWSHEDSPVVAVGVSEEYDCHIDSCPAGFDGLHPNSVGDFQIARAYTKVLHEHFGYGDGPLVVPPTESIPWAASEASDGDADAFLLPQENPPTRLFVGAAGLCLVVVAVALRRRRRSICLDTRYLRLPTTVKDENL